jgi:hypothetical protein
MLGKPGNHVAFASSGVELRHVSRDRIRIDNKSKDLKGELTVTYDQAYDLKQQLISFLGAYVPDSD